jgi:hypothetical protein
VSPGGPGAVTGMVGDVTFSGAWVRTVPAHPDGTSARAYFPRGGCALECMSRGAGLSARGRGESG